jgi:hypothetical protein
MEQITLHGFDGKSKKSHVFILPAAKPDNNALHVSPADGSLRVKTRLMVPAIRQSLS